MFEPWNGDERREAQRGIRFDPTINLGNILALIGLVFMLWQMNNSVVTKLAAIESKVELLWTAYERTPK